MLDASAALKALFVNWRRDATMTPYIADCYTITLPSGREIDWTAADKDIPYLDTTWTRGPGLAHGQISKAIGTQAAELDVNFSFDDRVTIDGVKMAAFIAGGGLLYATVAFYRAFALTRRSAIIGVLPKFQGRVTRFSDTGETHSGVTVSDIRSLLNVQVPVNVWQPQCLHTVFDDDCGLDRELFRVDGHTLAGSTSRTLVTDLSSAVGYLDLGKVVFTSGVNNGQTRTVKTQLADGTVKVVRPFVTAPNIGDSFKAYPGCDQLESTCLTKFNNRRKFEGQPFVPVAETAA